jgi:hypothetical protein
MISRWIFVGLLMDCLVRSFYGGSVRKEYGVFEDMEEELKMFDAVVPSFSDLLFRVKEKFDVAFTLKGRFDSGKTRAHFILMPLRNKGHWSHYTRVIQGSIMTMAEVVVENGYRKEDMEDKLSFDGIGGDEHQWGVDVDATYTREYGFGRSVDAGATSFLSNGSQ